jgi:hypothetical protein
VTITVPDAGAEKRRLSPIPEDWRTASDAELEVMSARAEVATSRRRRQKDPGPEDRRESE